IADIENPVVSCLNWISRTGFALAPNGHVVPDRSKISRPTLDFSIAVSAGVASRIEGARNSPAGAWDEVFVETSPWPWRLYSRSGNSWNIAGATAELEAYKVSII